MKLTIEDKARCKWSDKLVDQALWLINHIDWDIIESEMILDYDSPKLRDCLLFLHNK